MSKIVIIDACCDCPYRFYHHNQMICDKTDKYIYDEETIPEWCPLQDAKDYVIKEKTK